MAAVRYLYRLALSLWLGSIFFFAVAVAPALFRVLTPAESGSVVRQLIPFIDTYGVIAGPALVVLAVIVEGRRRRTLFRAGLLLVMAVCAAASLWIVSPRIKEAVAGTQEFRALHGASVGLMMVEAVLGLIALGFPVREPNP